MSNCSSYPYPIRSRGRSGRARRIPWAHITHNGHASLNIASLSEDIATIQNVLEAGADADCTAKGHGCSSLLHHATTSKTMEALLQYDPDVNIADGDGKTVLYSLISTTLLDLAAAKALVNIRTRLNLQDNKGRTPILDMVLIVTDSSSSSSGSHLIVDYLPSKKADLKLSTLLDASPLHCKQGNLTLT